MNIKVTGRPIMTKKMVEWGVLCPTKPNEGDIVLVTSKKGKQWIAMIRWTVEQHSGGGWICLTDKVKLVKDKDAESRRQEWMMSHGLDPF